MVASDHTRPRASVAITPAARATRGLISSSRRSSTWEGRVSNPFTPFRGRAGSRRALRLRRRGALLRSAGHGCRYLAAAPCLGRLGRLGDAADRLCALHRDGEGGALVLLVLLPMPSNAHRLPPYSRAESSASSASDV